MSAAEPKGDLSPRSNVGRAVGEGLLLTLAQIALACIVGAYADGAVSADPDQFVKSYYKLVNSEGQWQRRIAEEGYQTDKEFVPGKRGNVAFFPGYPMLVKSVHLATGWTWPLCLLVVSQLACWGFWTYFLLLLDRHDVPLPQARLAAAFLAAQPASFFLVAGCADSLFLFSLLGFVYWIDAERPGLEWIGVLHGILMTATSLVGLPLVIYPLLRGYLRAGDGNWAEKLFGGLFLSVVSSLGAVAFFVYCQQYLGAWDIVMKTQELHWDVRPNVFALVELNTYVLDVELWMVDGFLSPDWLSRVLVPGFVLLFAILFMVEAYVALILPNPTTAARIGYFALAFVIFFTVTAELFGNQYRSMIRAILFCEILLVIELAHMLNNEDVEGVDWGTFALAGILIVPALIAQTAFLHRFMNGLWVA